MAAVFARGRAGIGDFTDEAIKSPDILDISGKIRIEVDADLKRAKGMEPAKIGVKTKQGKTYVAQTDSSPGGSEQPLPFSAYERKFRDCAAYSVKPLPGKQVDSIIAKIKRLEQVDDIRELVELLS